MTRDSGRPSAIVSFISGLSKNLRLKGRILSERATVGWRGRSNRSWSGGAERFPSVLLSEQFGAKIKFDTRSQTTPAYVIGIESIFWKVPIMTNELDETLERFKSLPDEAILPSRVTGIILGVSERTVRYHPNLPRVQISRGRYGQRVGDIRKLCREGMPRNVEVA